MDERRRRSRSPDAPAHTAGQNERTFRMKRIFHASVAAAAFALLAGGAMAQTAAPVTDAPATAPGTSTAHQGKELGEMKQTPAEKKAEHEKKQSVAPTAKSGAKHTAKQQSAAATKPGKHVEKNANDAVASEPAKKL
jgi:hypothetical protein